MNQEENHALVDAKARAVWELLIEEKTTLTPEDVTVIGASLVVCMGWLVSLQPKEFSRDVLRAVRLMSERRGRMP
jgi:hypothetical protein